MKNVEIEYKWEANAPGSFLRAERALQKLTARYAETVLPITDVYMEDATGSFAKKQVAFRVRNTGSNWEATFKTRTQVKQGKAVRREETLRLPGVQNLAQAISVLQTKQTWKGLNISRLQPKFKIKNLRRVYAFMFGRAQLELALDNVTICVLGRQLKMKEIELELKRGRAGDLEKFAQQFAALANVIPAKISKVKTAETLLALWKNNFLQKYFLKCVKLKKEANKKFFPSGKMKKPL